MDSGTLSVSDPDWWDIMFFQPSGGELVGLLVIVLLLFTSAMISGSEVAFFSLTPGDKSKLQKNGRDSRICKHLLNPEKLLATILVANNFVNISIIVIFAFVTSGLIDFSRSPVLEFVFQVVIITILLVLFGEILPKVYATHHSLAFARVMAFPLSILEKVFRPVNALLIHSTSFVNRKLRKQQKNISMNEISQALELTSTNELSDEKEILEGIVKFGNKSVGEIMIPRVDVVAIDIKSPFSGVLDTINASGYSRIPVFAESFDQIKGILYIKDLLPHTDKGTGFIWQILLRPPFFVPETKKIKALLEDFQKNKVHMAIVVDEYGGSAGIITLEDVLEEIVGDIADEFDEDEHFYTRLGDRKFLFDGKTSLVDFHKVTGCDETIFDDVKGEADSLAGLILELRGEFPVLNEKIECKQFIFSIEAVTNRRIKQIKVEIV